MNQGELPLRDLTVEGYRGIRHLRLPELGRVNLFVGKNNAGKSSLLEAIRLGLEENPSAIAALIYDGLRAHTDYHPRFQPSSGEGALDAEEIEAVVAAVESMFFGGFEESPRSAIRIIGERDKRVVAIHGPRSRDAIVMDDFAGDGMFFGPESRLLTILAQPDAKRSETIGIPVGLFINRVPIRFRARGDTLHVPAQGLDAREARELWDRLAVTGDVSLVEDAMRSIWPTFERAVSAGDNGRRSVFIKLRDVARAVPLQSLGDGVQRVFALAVALALSSGGALTVDEVENGLHHTAQLEVWDSMFLLAEKLNVQVFATTHSWEAVVAFQEAANRSPSKGMLYRLEREDDGSIYAERYTERDVAVATEHQVEVR
ncbi:AAA family ATPase [Longimicrobium sp.]|uniref:AAA family ATPase n=1 Tax=Longimicrobium sp. TaxID=2029185 RepID=UPI002E347CEB|nr:AAA family ATPase [Longimicrobium sp.]HEX6042111.1 AAA family ATPase [Longimicrobium sp.]